jgi:hypothetical protein
LKKLILSLFIIIISAPLISIDFDPDESLSRFNRGHYAGFSIFPSYEGRNTLLELSLYGNFSFNSFAFGLHIPVRFLLHNKDEVETSAKVFPKNDWDEARDWVKLLTFFQYGHREDLFYFYFGEHKNRYIGNGSILGAYNNTLKFNFPKRGVNIGVTTDYAGLDFFMDDVTPPNVIGGRSFVKPLSFLDKDNYFNNLELGFTFIADVFAPESIGYGPESVNGIAKRDVKEGYNQVLGFDINFRFLATEYYHLSFYGDWNKILDAGSGFHFGLKHSADLPTFNEMRILSKWEYRAMQSNYVPSYFNTFYDIQREYYRDNQTKSGFLSDPSRKGKDWTHGYYLDLVFDLTRKVSVGSSFEHNRIYKNSISDGKFDNFVINVFANVLLFKKIGADFTITFEDVGVNKLSDDPYYKLSAYYLLSDFITVGFTTRSAWQLRYSGRGLSTTSSYENVQVYSLGAYGSIRF